MVDRNIRNLERLINSGEERTRLTSQLQKIISEVLETIAENVTIGTKITVSGKTFQLKRFSSNIGSAEFICLESEGKSVIFTATCDPGSNFFLHNDFNCEVINASRDEFLFVANILPEIIQAFQADQNKAIAALREAFAKLQKLQ